MTLRLKHMSKTILNAVLPPACPVCRAEVADAGTLCAACWGALTFVSDPQCDACGLPFELDAGSHFLCGSCAAKAPPYVRARAAVLYNDASKPLVLALKHGDRTDIAPTLANFMGRAGAGLLGEVDVVVSVPLHWTRLFKRRFNQSAELARKLAKLHALPFRPDGLRRIKRTPSQGRMGRSARLKNVQGAFRVPKRAQGHVRGKSVLLVDDVMTSGATVEAASKALLRGGAARVFVLTFARVVRGIA